MVNFSAIERKWQKKWEEKKVFQVKENSKKKKFYCLEMFPYPSGSGLHMGHAFQGIIGDIYARFKRMNGFNVLYPMGYDSFGLPAENAAIKAKIHPKKYTEKSVSNFIKQQKELGISYDWSRIFKTSDEEYYKWNQYLFLQFMKKGLVYRKKSIVNWCPKCKTVLANEQVHNGKCWRHETTDVIEKSLEQWFIKTTKYSDELLKDIDKLDWPERIKAMQQNWIGKSKGTMVKFKIKDSIEHIEVFTTRPDTLYGVTFLVYSIQHPKVLELCSGTKQENKVKEFLKNVPKQGQEIKDKEGVFVGRYAVHPLTGEEIPIYASNFVVADYATGVVMAVPAHDQRDFEFAKKYDVAIKVVVQNKNKSLRAGDLDRAYTREGELVSSGEFTGTNSKKAIDDISKFLKENKLGSVKTQYKLRDWLVSRQRYWGTPIPVIYCDKCGVIPDENLPVKLPDRVKFGKGNPLETNKEFVNTKCPICGAKARRETDTMDTFFDSSWYFLRYCDSKNKKEPFDKNKVKYWMPVDQYIGGAEHACMHLIYARFFVKALRDLKMLKFDEPFKKLFNQGMLHKNCFVMSKSRGNVVLPETISKKYGIDTARLYLVSIASPDKDTEWDDKGVEGSYRFVSRVYDYLKKVKISKSSKRVESKVNSAIKEVTEDVENFKYNLAVIKIRSLFDSLEDEISKKDLESFIKLLSPFCPHIAEEIWSKIGGKGFVSLQTWPNFDAKKINKEFDAVDEFVASLDKDLSAIIKLVKFKPKKAKIAVAENWKYKFINDLKKTIIKTRNVGEVIKKTIDGKHNKDISKLIPYYLKDEIRIPKFVFGQKIEIEIIEEISKELRDRFGIEISVEKDNEKAMPGKPAIILE